MNVIPSDKIKRSDYDRFDEQVDPRVQVELEHLNAATDEINKLEFDLDEARTNFRQQLCEWSVHLEGISKKLGSSIEKARPYYEARIRAKEALTETQKAGERLERASSTHGAAKEMVCLAEEGLSAEGRTFDHAWQEMLNHATIRVNESELERTLSERHHKKTSLAYHSAELRVHQLERELKRHIAMSRPYFEAKAQCNKLLDERKVTVKELELKVSSAKGRYSEALGNLEQISDEIHRSRKCGYPGGEPLGLSAGSPDGTSPSSSTNLDSESTGSPDEEEYLRLPDSIDVSASPTLPYVEESPTDQWSEISLSPEWSGAQAQSGPQPSSPPVPVVAQHQRTLPAKPQTNNSSPRRQSLDVIISGSLATGERVKEIFEKGMMKLNMSLERRGSEPRLCKKTLSSIDRSGCLPVAQSDPDSDSVPSSVEMLSDDQISSLMLDQEIQQAYNDIFSSSQQTKSK